MAFLTRNTTDGPLVSTFSGLDASAYAWAGILLLATIILRSYLYSRKFDHIPVFGSSNSLSSLIQATRFTKEGKDWLVRGYSKYKSRIFRLPQIGRWHIIVTGDKLVDEYRKVPDGIFSVAVAFEETFQGRYLLGPTITSNRYHVAVIRNQLTRNMGLLFNDLRQEAISAIEDNIPIKDDWIGVTAYPAVLQIVARVANRMFVGLPVCRDPDYLSINIRHTLEVTDGAFLLLFFPEFLKPLAAQYLTKAPKSVARALGHLRPIIEERQRKIDEYGHDYPDKPSDFLSWLMDEAQGEERKPERLVNRIVHVNFAAVHTTSTSFTLALYHLAAQPEFIQPLREEVEGVVDKEGWSKASVSKMKKLDSFLKESQRFNGIASIAITRKALNDYTFSDGTFIPKGATLSAASFPRHHDDEVYENAEVFDPFRFSKIREKEGLSTSNQLVNTNPSYISFGHGSHACPGRFFVANEMKVILAHLVLNYDIKMENEGIIPNRIWRGFTIIPNPTAKILFKKRQT